MTYDNDHGSDLTKSKSNSEYVHILDEGTVWFIDYVLGVAFPTPINFADK
jgi:hypothetical protein